MNINIDQTNNNKNQTYINMLSINIDIKYCWLLIIGIISIITLGQY